jgi:hypothetical protein
MNYKTRICAGCLQFLYVWIALEIRLSSRYGRYSIDWFYLLNQNLDFYQHMSRGLLVFSDLRWEVIVRVTGIANYFIGVYGHFQQFTAICSDYQTSHAMKAPQI